jgi:hypothetical protein
MEFSEDTDVKFCKYCGSSTFEKIDESAIKKKAIEEDRKKTIEEIMSFMGEKEIRALLDKGWVIDSQSIETSKSLTGVKNVSGTIIMRDRCTVAMICNGTIDTEAKIAEYPLDYVDIAKKLGATSIIVTKKDYPCVAKLPDDKFLIIAPRVE